MVPTALGEQVPGLPCPCKAGWGEDVVGCWQLVALWVPTFFVKQPEHMGKSGTMTAVFQLVTKLEKNKLCYVFILIFLFCGATFSI